MRYLARLTAGKITLWCYLIWYVVFAARYFDPRPGLWVTSLGIAGIIGVALVISTGGTRGAQMDRWSLFRLFLMPFCVSSFSALVKGRGFLLVFSPWWRENVVAIGCCAAFGVLVAATKFAARR